MVNFAGDVAQIEHFNFQNNHVNACIPGIATPPDGGASGVAERH